MRNQNRKKTLLCGLLLAVLCTGCAMQSADDMYALPKQSDSYYDLQEAIDRVLAAGGSYAGPLTGSNQQAVQLADLDGDGQDEAIAFLKTGGEKPLKACIFDRNGDRYENTAVIEGVGSDFDFVEYAQLDGKPGLEIILGRRLSDQILQSIGGYAYLGDHCTELMSANYSEFQIVDLNSDDRKDVVVFRMETDGGAGVAELYRYEDNHMELVQTANLSPGAKQIKRILSGYVAQGVPAVFVASDYEAETIVTDIFACVGQEFRNVAISSETGLSAQTMRSYQVYATDIDEDGVIELPMPVALPSATAAEETHWIIDWYNLLPESGKKVKLTTYHCYSGGWYLVLPEQWHDQLTVTRTRSADGVQGYMFSKWNGYGQETEEIVTICTFTGEDRLAQAQADGRWLLAEKGEVAYSAAFGTCDWADGLTKEEFNAMFRFIYLDWNNGET